MGGQSLCVSQPTPTPAFLFPCIPSPSELHPTSKRDMRMKDGKSCCCCSSDDIFRPSSSLFFSLFQRRTHSQVILRKRNDQEIESRGPRIVNRSEVVENHIRGLSLCGPFKCCSCLSLSLSLSLSGEPVSCLSPSVCRPPPKRAVARLGRRTLLYPNIVCQCCWIIIL